MNVLVKISLTTLIVVGIGGGIWYALSKGTLPTNNDPLAKIEKFKSEQDFKDYLSKAPTNTGTGFGGIGRGVTMLENRAVPLTGGAPSLKSTDQAVPPPDRYSQTNVQVKGIDEPDIVKTDGKEIYVSSPFQYRILPGEIQDPTGVKMSLIDPGEPSIYPPQEQTGGTKAVKAFPPQNLKVDNTINKSGELLLSGNNLIILSDQYPRKIFSYDVQNPASPAEKWTHELKNNNEIVASRLYQGKLYLVTRTQLNPINPCPIVSLITIPCTEIYHPMTPVPADVTYTAFTINTDSGSVEKNVSFVGSSSDSIVYMSEGAIYISYFYPGDFIVYFANFLSENKDLYPAEISNRISKLKSYDISSQAKMTEMSQILEQYQSSLDNDARLKLENETQNRMADYGKKHNRELGKTGLVKISTDGLNVQASGVVPGRPLNQFSLDEYQNNLRVATTVGDNWWGFNGGRQESANDVYVLDSNLNQIGSITDLGLTEKIYSARFIGERGYLVTFRQTDPFYVLDLSNPRAPKMTGELKIPGFSSYLHPLKDNQILGVGQENGRVKLSLFDVLSPSSPQELAKYNLNDNYSEVSNNHHAFQQDAKHQIFFLPGGQGAYIFSYQGNNLRLVKALAQVQARRALYINDYLYIVGDQKITVLDENTWEIVKELSF